ncbi:MAG: response regulator transcription factor [Actinobacteria bacterium]|nr:response regulator transcription factor [Actinomycetota bacterium]
MVEDDETVSGVLSQYLLRDGFLVDVVDDGEQALARIAEHEPDLVILDIMLPGISGFEVCRSIRKVGKMPIVVLSARGEESDRVLGLELGADDYIVKPFSNREVAARVRAVLRRSESLDRSDMSALPLRHGNVAVDPVAHEVTVSGSAVHLTAREFELLVFFMRHPGRAFRREELLEHVWGYRLGGTSTVTVHIQRLREKVERDPRSPELIVTVWGAGYRFAAAATG